jgi:hypothetical protein
MNKVKSFTVGAVILLSLCLSTDLRADVCDDNCGEVNISYDCVVTIEGEQTTCTGRRAKGKGGGNQN